MAGTLHDDVFGDFAWGDTEYCSGTVQWFGVTIPWSIELDCGGAPTARDFEDAVRRAKHAFGKLTPASELESRQAAARQVLDAVYHQSAEQAPPDHVTRLVEDMRIDSIDFSFAPRDAPATITLTYTSQKVLPAQKIVVQFDEKLKPWEATLQT